MTQALYAHMNNKIKKLIINKKKECGGLKSPDLFV
jgi:hypothetical protein